MVKTLIVLVVGMLLGVGAVLTIQNPHKVAEAVKAFADRVDGKVEAATRKQCVDAFHARTHCYQDHSKSLDECDASIVEECGPPN